MKQRRDHRNEAKLLYAEFLKIILDFQLQEHEKFLFPFIHLFKMVDIDNNGIVNEEEFRNLILGMNVLDYEEDVHALLQIIDPNNNKQMTFSEII